jgi:hypothetical protein
MHNQHTERQSLPDQLSPLREGHEEESYGHEGDLSGLFDKAARQRRLDEIVSRAPPETD